MRRKCNTYISPSTYMINEHLKIPIRKFLKSLFALKRKYLKRIYLTKNRINKLSKIQLFNIA